MNGSLAQGTIYQYRPKAKDQKLVNLRPELDTGFHPHGISVYEDPDGKIFLAVVNHHSGGLFNSSEGHSIELFRYEVDSLFHIRSVSGPLMISPNDIVLINKDQFYVTNDHGSSSGLMQTLEEYLQLRRCNALFYDGKKFSVAASGLGFDELEKEDYGQTLARWGVGEGCYVVLPILGPSTVRDAVGSLTSFIGGDPWYNVTVRNNTQYFKDSDYYISRGTDGLDFRAKNIDSFDNLEKNSMDFYASVRSLFLQDRKQKILNSNKIVDTQDDSDWDEIQSN